MGNRLLVLYVTKCNRGQLVRAVGVNLTPLISRGALATDTRDWSF